jgi:magnesium transporter
VNFRSFRVNEDRHLESVEVDREQLTAEAENGPLWVDVESATPEEIEKLLAPLELHPLVIEGCVEPGDRIRVEPFDDAVLLSYPTGNIEHEIHYARIVCLQNILITIRDRLHPGLESKLRLSRVRLRTRSVAAVLFYLLDISLDDNILAAHELRDEVTQLVDRIEDDPELVSGGDIQSLKRQKRTFAVVFEDQLACLKMLRQLGTGVLVLDELKEYFEDLVGALDYLDRMMERLDLQLQDARQQYQTALQDKTNRRLNVLTIVQAVFVPLTLIAGIYGMNFARMPELQWPYAYLACLGVMVAIVLGELWLFYRNGWFD